MDATPLWWGIAHDINAPCLEALGFWEIGEGGDVCNFEVLGALSISMH